MALLGVALWTTFVLASGYPLAFYQHKALSGAPNNCSYFYPVALWDQFLVRTYALQTIIGKEGFLNSACEPLGLSANL
ncbi:MAG: hypothetical protein R2865_02820 [Deinococcales bacterium]